MTKENKKEHKIQIILDLIKEVNNG